MTYTTNRLLSGYSEDERKVIAWQKANPIPGYDPGQWRTDCDGRVINWPAYGRISDYGWEIDHAIPLSLGGYDVPANWRARHYRGNRSAGGLLGSK